MSDNYLQKFVRQASHYIFGQGVVILAGFISFPLLTRLLTTAEYGVLNLVAILLWTAVAFTKGGLQESAVRFYSDFEKEDQSAAESVYYNTLMGGSLLFALAGALIFWALMTFFLRHQFMPEINELIPLITFLIIVDSLYNRLTNFLRAEQRTRLLNMISIVERYLGLLLGIGFLLIISKKLVYFYSGLLLSELTLASFLFYLYLREKKFSMGGISFPFLKQCIAFGVPLIGFELANYLIKSGDRYVIQYFMGASAVGLYSAASNLCYYLRDILLFPILYAITPIYLQMWKREGAQETSQFISKILKYIIYIAVPVIVGFSVMGDKILVVLASDKYLPAATIIPYIISGTVFFSLYPLLSAGLYIQKKTMLLTAMIGVGVVLNAGLNILLVPIFSLIGAAVATLVTYTILLIAVGMLSARYLPVSINLAGIGKSLLGSAGIFLIVKNLDFGNQIIGLFGIVLVGALFYGIFLFMVDSEIRRQVFNMFVVTPG